jgi:outer membrane immunogenic protein
MCTRIDLEGAMKRYLLIFSGLLALAGSTGTVSAADQRPAPPAKAPATMPYNWTGFYVGFNAGGGWGTSSWDALPSSFKTSGVMGGAQFGYNWQFSQLVLGLEADADWSSVTSSGFTGCNVGSAAGGCNPQSGTAVCTVGGLTGTCGTSNDFLATVRGRFGYAYDRWMPYVTGGLAFGNIRTTGPTSAPNAVGMVTFIGNDQTNLGWTVGGGLEFALPANWTAKVEYLYVNLGNAPVCAGCSNATFTSNVVRAGINYRF